jgi:hypothetical protein
VSSRRTNPEDRISLGGAEKAERRREPGAAEAKRAQENEGQKRWTNPHQNESDLMKPSSDANWNLQIISHQRKTSIHLSGPIIACFQNQFFADLEFFEVSFGALFDSFIREGETIIRNGWIAFIESRKVETINGRTMLVENLGRCPIPGNSFEQRI